MHAVLTNQNTDIWNFNDNINYHVLIASSYFKEKEITKTIICMKGKSF